MMNTWNTLLESYQQRVYNNTLATVNREIQQAENSTPAVVISTEAASIDNATRLDNLTSEVALEEPEIGKTDPNIPIDTNCTDDRLHFGIPGASGGYKGEGDESDEHDAIRTACWRRRPATELKRFELGTSNVDWYEGDEGDNADADAVDVEEGSQADYGSTQNVED
jgi:hypothetical protein